jgi:hypothetical protein
MPNSITVSGGGGISILNASAIAQGINQAADVDVLIERLDSIILGLKEIRFQTQTEPPILSPIVEGALNQWTETPLIPGIAGKHLQIKYSGYYDLPPTDGSIEVVGSDGQTYFRVPLLAARTGLIMTAKMPIGLGAKIRLAPGGPGVMGTVNYASGIY